MFVDLHLITLRALSFKLASFVQMLKDINVMLTSSFCFTL